MKAADRELLRTGERSCIWCHNEIWGDYGELLHVLCAPNVDQVDLFRADMKRLVLMDKLALGCTSLQAIVAGVGYAAGGLTWMDGVGMVLFAAATTLVRFASEERVLITKGMWRKSRHQLAAAAQRRAGR